MKIFRSILITAITLAFLAWLLPTVSYLNLFTLILASLVFTLLQKIIKPVLKILFLPINIVTLGLFSVVLNVFLLWLVTFMVPGLQIQVMKIGGVGLGQFGSYMLISFIISLIQWLISLILQ
ncbi:MAG: phage holin family protein [Patescibacteria group bacterium]|nr:phage holin family protein [Patescibacteria group bacterium]